MVQIDHVHFYVDPAQVWRNWFVHLLGFQCQSSLRTLDHEQDVLDNGHLKLHLSAPRSPHSPIAQFLQKHPPGVADIALRVQNLAEICAHPKVRVLIPPHQTSGGELTAQIAAWGSLRHTLIQGQLKAQLEEPALEKGPRTPELERPVEAIDHSVLNVPRGELQAVVEWYCQVLGFTPQQQFTIATARSSLHSQVLVHPDSGVQLPINEPTSANSQIQEFLDHNRGAGIQHIALKTPDILHWVPQLRQLGLSFLKVPGTYYEGLRQKPGFCLKESEWRQLIEAEILVDWNDATYPALLLQTFTEPIFKEPTFFFELIERRSVQVQGQSITAQGFGEGNFQALFEAVEQQQLQRRKPHP
ncbi:4-hydroxyphenylpyruvate dioxygenase [Geitlerinema sp. P-1104]|uniref:4-hydroxyphenylpyruvate dioxygenase n=1 Tax=Geitlerinema sp. P-1104 TaxID=2546230 RepID=UPI001476DD6D|nr:4-hydroxyphenylpyruvate dioxygenase [Geitlerinema sp. P-1104]NMG58123.1 4-hydroxyphenylpyruvate dioxygenase [Geitlerinema sp. P-1104]